MLTENDLAKIGRLVEAIVETKLEERLKPIEDRLSVIENRLAVLESRMSTLEKRLITLENEFYAFRRDMHALYLSHDERIGTLELAIN